MEIREKEEVKAERLVLKPCVDGDREALAGLLMNEEIAKTFMVPDYPTKEQYLELADTLIGFSRIENVKHLVYGVFLDGEMIGFVNDCGFDEEEIEIGYVIHPDRKGRGYATEAVRAVIGDLWDMGFQKVTAGFFEENPASRRVMEKSGMVLNGRSDEGEYRGKIHKCYYCEIRRPDL